MALTNPNKVINVQELDYFRQKADIRYASSAELQQLAQRVVSLITAIYYEDVYIGVGATSSSVMIAANHYDAVYRNRKFSFSNVSSDYVWVIMPQAYSPSLLMGGVEVPISLDSTTTVGDVTYKIWKSANSYSGAFDIYVV